MVLNEAKPTPMIGIDRPLVDRVVQCIMVRHTPNQAGFDSTAEHRRLKQWVCTYQLIGSALKHTYYIHIHGSEG